MAAKAAVIIPARYGSTRFPGKPLVILNSRPLIQWVYEGINKSKSVSRVVIATDDERIYSAVLGFGGDVVKTSSGLRTGSDRCAEVSKDFEEDVIVNLQADEILKGPEMIDELVQIMSEDPSVLMGTLKKEIILPEELWDRNVVKVVSDKDDYAIYFSRSPIPYVRDRVFNNEERLPHKTFYKHLGIYAYRRDFLQLFSKLPASRLEDLEKLEQLRVLESGFKIKIKETGYESYRIDTPEDLINLEKVLCYDKR